MKKDAAPAVEQATAINADGSSPQIVAGHELLRELARGGLGVVYLARHRVLNDLRAIKRPQARSGPEQEMLHSRFQREVGAVGALRNDHVIRAHDAGSDEDGPYLVMEYVDGEPLSGLIARHGPLAVPEACELIRQVALGLQAAHDKGLVHRDVKPSNLMLARSGSGVRVVVIDWGLVKRAADRVGDANACAALTNAGSTIGTLDFIAPEQIADASDVDIRADLYSLGATLYCLLAGRAPYQGRSNREKLQAHLIEAFPPVAGVRSDVPHGVLDVLERMVAKDPGQRYATPADVANALRPFCCGAESRLLAELLEEASGQRNAATPETARIPAKETRIAANSAAASAVATPSQKNGPASRTGEKTASRKQRAPATTHREGMGRWLWGLIILFLLAGGGGAMAIISLGNKARENSALGEVGNEARQAASATVPNKIEGEGPGGKQGQPQGLQHLAGQPVDAEQNAEKSPPIAGDDPAESVRAPQVAEAPSSRTSTGIQSQTLLDEDFSKALQAGLALPEGWAGNFIGVVSDSKGRACLEVNRKSGEHFVTVPRLMLGGRFSIEGDYAFGQSSTGPGRGSQSLTIELKSNATGARVPVVIDSAGFVVIANNEPRRLWQPSPVWADTRDGETHIFRVLRNGKVLRVELDGDPIAVATIDEKLVFDTIRLGLTAKTERDVHPVRLYHVQVNLLSGPVPEQGVSPAATGVGGTGNRAQPTDTVPSTALLDEDFSKALAEARALPEGWRGAAFGVIANQDGRACLEVTKSSGEHFVTLPALKSGVNFSMEGEYELYGVKFNDRPTNQSLTIQLEAGTGRLKVPVIIDFQGFVTIDGDEPKQAPSFSMRRGTPTQNFIPARNVVHRFRLVRNGKVLRVEINGDPVATAKIHSTAEFSAIRLGLTAGTVHGTGKGFTARLYSLRIDELPAAEAGAPDDDDDLPANKPKTQPKKAKAKSPPTNNGNRSLGQPPAATPRSLQSPKMR